MLTNNDKQSLREADTKQRWYKYQFGGLRGTHYYGESTSCDIAIGACNAVVDRHSARAWHFVDLGRPVDSSTTPSFAIPEILVHCNLIRRGNLCFLLEIREHESFGLSTLVVIRTPPQCTQPGRVERDSRQQRPAADAARLSISIIIGPWLHARMYSCKSILSDRSTPPVWFCPIQIRPNLIGSKLLNLHCGTISPAIDCQRRLTLPSLAAVMRVDRLLIGFTRFVGMKPIHDPVRPLCDLTVILVHREHRQAATDNRPGGPRHLRICNWTQW